MSKYLAIAAAIAFLVLGAACGFLYWQVGNLHERTGKLEESNKQLTETVNAKIKATQGRAQNDSTVRQLPPAGIIERLR